jgi:hypothetical protein
MFDQPAVHSRSFVGGKVVADEVDLKTRLDLTVDLVEEVPEVHCPVPCGGFADHLSRGCVQRGEQVDGAVPRW